MNYEMYWDFAKTSIFDAPSTVVWVSGSVVIFFVFVVFVSIGQPGEYSSIRQLVVKNLIHLFAFLASLCLLGFFAFYDQLHARYLISHRVLSVFEGKVEGYRASEASRPFLEFSVNGRSFSFNFNEYISPSFYLVKDMPLKNGSRVRLTYVEPSLDPTWWWIGGREWVTRFEIARDETRR